MKPNFESILFRASVACLLSAVPISGAVPLPDSPVLLQIHDVAAFDKALTGGFRKAALGTLPAADPAGAAWKRTAVGGKLDAQWELFSNDLPLTWSQILALKPSEIGLSLLSAGDLEAVLVLRTPLAVLPLPLPAGSTRHHRGVAWHLVTKGAGDERLLSRRLGLAWARTSELLYLATSERALLLALDAGTPPGRAEPLVGFASLRLDMDRLSRDRYFSREFLFVDGQRNRGVITASLAVEGDTLVELREGPVAETLPAARWPIDKRGVLAAGWEPDGDRFLTAFRRTFLEPLPGRPVERPVPAEGVLPSAASAAEDSYLVDLTHPLSDGGKAGPGELTEWASFLRKQLPRGWGWEISENGAPRIVILASPPFDIPFLDLCAATIGRRAGTVTRNEQQILVGPGLPALAVKRRGGSLWIATRAEDLAEVPEALSDPALLRWGRTELSLLRSQSRRWKEAEGSFSPDVTRPFSDRILGLLGWAPSLQSISVEKRMAGERFQERVVFAFARPSAPASQPRKPVPPAKKGTTRQTQRRP
jgi:hypothetical protein